MEYRQKQTKRNIVKSILATMLLCFLLFSNIFASNGTSQNTEDFLDAYDIALIDAGTESAESSISVVENTESQADYTHADAMLSYIKEENPDARVLSINVFQADGKAVAADVAEAIRMAITHRVKIINLSIIAKDLDQNKEVKNAIREATKQGVLVVAAAGNMDDHVSSYIPANMEEVLVVSSCNENGEEQANSNFGSTVDYSIVAQSTSEAAARLSGKLSKGIQSKEELLQEKTVFLPEKQKSAGAEDVFLREEIQDGYFHQAAEGMFDGTYTDLRGSTVKVASDQSTFGFKKLVRAASDSPTVTFSSTGWQQGYVQESEGGSYVHCHYLTYTPGQSTLGTSNTYFDIVSGNYKLRVTFGGSMSVYHGTSGRTYGFAVKDNGAIIAAAPVFTTSSGGTRLTYGLISSGNYLTYYNNKSYGNIPRLHANITLRLLDKNTDAAFADLDQVYVGVHGMDQGSGIKDGKVATGGITNGNFMRSADSLLTTSLGYDTTNNYVFARTGSGGSSSDAHAVYLKTSNGNGYLGLLLYATTRDIITLSMYTKTYTVSYNSNGGSSQSSQTVNGGEAVTLPTPTRTGYTFGGWYREAALTNRVGGGGGSYTPSAHITLYAKWTSTLSYNLEGGSGGPSAATMNYVDAYRIPHTNNPTRTGYTFMGWATSDANAKAGTVNYDTRSADVQYKAANTWSPNATLYAVWRSTLSFNANNGSGAPGNINMYYTGATTIPSTTPTRTGYTFTGWNTAQDGSGTAYAAVATFKSANTWKVNTTLYAQWAPTTGSIYYNAGTSYDTLQGTAIGNANCDALVSYGTRTGFAGKNGSIIEWHYNIETCDGASNNPSTFNPFDTTELFNPPTGYKHNAVGQQWRIWNATKGTWLGYVSAASIDLPSMISTNFGWGDRLFFFANWAPIEYQVRYNGNGSTSGSMVNSEHTYAVAKNLTANAYTKTGFVFTGWNTAPDGSGTNYADMESVINLTTTDGAVIDLYAQWEPNTGLPYDVIFHSNYPTDTTVTQTIETDKTVPLRKNTFTRTGYTFLGWSLSPDSDAIAYRDKTAVRNIATSDHPLHLYAVWQENPDGAFVDIDTEELPQLTVTEENEGKFLIVETKSTPGYVMDGSTAEITDIDRTTAPGTFDLDGTTTPIVSTVTGDEIRVPFENEPNSYTISKVDENGDLIFTYDGDGVFILDEAAVFEFWVDNLTNPEYYGTAVTADSIIATMDQVDVVRNPGGTVISSDTTTVPVHNHEQIRVDSTGHINLTRLHPGTWHYKEVVAPEGFALNPSTYSFVVDKDGYIGGTSKTGSASVMNTEGGFYVYKTDISGNPVPGIVFEVRQGSDTATPTAYTSDANGYVDLGTLVRSFTANTTLYIKEAEASQQTNLPEGMVVSDTQNHIVEVTVNLLTGKPSMVVDGGTASELGFLNIQNDSNSFRIYKKDATTNAPLAGAVFRVWNEAEGKDYTVTTGESGYTPYLYKLESGTWKVQETKAPEGYTLDDTEQTFTVDATTHKIAGNTEHSITVSNQETNLVIKKVDASTDDPIEGIVFELENQNTGAAVEQTTGNDGTATWEKLKDGIYDLTEMEAVDGYVRLIDSIRITVTNGHIFLEDNTEVTDEPFSLILENSKNNFKLIKIDAEDPTHVIEEVGFVINGDLYETNEHGEILLESLEPGDYTVQESVPGTYEINEQTYNYVLDSTLYEFTVNEDGTVTCDEPFAYNEETGLITCRLTNARQEKAAKIKIRKVGDIVEGEVLEGAEFTLYKETVVEVPDPLDPSNTVEDLQMVLEQVEETNEFGIAVFEGLTVGNYQIKETRAPEGYYLETGNEWTQDVEITASDCERSNLSSSDPEYREFIYTYDVNNKENSYTIRKIDGSTSEPLAGAVFKVWKETGGATIAYDEFGNPVADEALLETNANGEIILYQLKDGTYYYSEIRAPIGYFPQRDSNGDLIVRSFTVVDSVITDGANSGYQIGSTPINNLNSYDLSIYIKKVNEEDEEITGAVFKVYEWDATYYDAENDQYGHYDTEGAIQTIYYNATTKTASINGQAYHYYNDVALPYTEQNQGRFLIVETETEGGYFADWAREVSIDTTSAIQNQEIVFDNDTIVVNTDNELRVYKVDSLTQDPLVGATFLLESYMSEEDKAVLEGDYYHEERTVTEAGVPILFSTIPSGFYALTETQAPANYSISDEVIYLIVDESGQIVLAQIPEEESNAILEPKPEEEATGILEIMFGDKYPLFTLHKVGQVNGEPVEDPETGEITVEKEEVPLENVKFEFKAGRWLSTGDFQEYPSGSDKLGENDFIGYLVKGTKEGGYTPADEDAEGIKIYQGDVLITDENGDIQIKMPIEAAWQYTEVETVAPYSVPRVYGELIPKYFDVKEQKLSDEEHDPSAWLDVKVLNIETGDHPYMDVQIEKIDGNTGEHIDNVVFEVYAYNALTRKYDTLATTLIKDDSEEHGFYINEEDSLPVLPENDYGKYKIVEVSAEDGYVADWSAQIDWSIQLMWSFTGENAVKNYKNELVIDKHDAMSKRPLSGARIELWTSEESDTVIGYLEDGTAVQNHQVFTTGSKKIRINSLINDRTYYAQELSAPIGFKKLDGIKSVYVNADGLMYGDDEIPEELAFVSDPDGTFTLTVQNEETNEPVANAMYRIWVEELEEGEVIGQITGSRYVDDDEDGNPIYEPVLTDVLNNSVIETNENGEILLEGLGEYTYYYQSMSDIPTNVSYTIQIPNVSILAAGGAGRTAIYITGLGLLFLTGAGLVVFRRKKSQKEN